MSACQICAGTLSPCQRFAPYPFVECARCGFIFRPDLDDARLAEVYTAGDYESLRGEEYMRALPARLSDARVRLSYVRQWSPGGRLLDIGAAAGAFVYEASSGGFDASGIEPVPGFARVAREHFGVSVTGGTLSEVPLPDSYYQTITLWHVLEHLPDPVRHLRQAADALSDGGILAIEVPNAGSAIAARMGSSWPSLEPEVHVNQFTPASLRATLAAGGLSVVDLHTSTITPYLTPRARFGVRHLAARAKAFAWLGSIQHTHPTGHELLRAVARRMS
jgi:2-polyprenyl-3-methyl-5-hydroxy-6-metoxy-1,4-benzoquinol methylase